MSNAKRDQNDRAVGLGVSSTDSVTPVMIRLDPVTNHLLCDMTVDTTVASIATRDKRDQNDVPTIYGISSTDGTTLVPIRTDSNGRLLTDFI